MRPLSLRLVYLVAVAALALPARAAEPRLFPHVVLLESSGNIVSESSPERETEFYKISLNGELKLQHLGRAVYTSNTPGTILKFGGKGLMQGGFKVGNGRVKVEGELGLFPYRCACVSFAIPRPAAA